MQQPLLVDRFSPHRYVTRDRVREDETVLHHTPRMRTPHMRVHILQQDVPHTDRPLVRLVETKQQLDKRRLPAAARPYDRRHLMFRDREADMFQHIVTVRPVIAEAHIFDPERPLFRDPVRFQGKRLFLILLLMDLAEPLQADLRILERTREADELLDRSRQLPYDIRQRHHHTQRHFTRNNSPRRQKGDQDIGGLVKKHRSELLILLQGQALDAYLEQFHLDALPFPPFLRLAVVQLDLLHAGHQLEKVALFARSLREPLDVQFAPVLHKGQYPRDIQPVANQEQPQYRQVIISQYEPEHDKIDKRKKRRDGRTRHERLDTVMVADALHDVPHHLRIEEMQGQPHQLGKKIGDQRDIDPGVDMQQDPATDKINREFGHEDHQLRYQYQGNKTQITVPDTRIHHALRQERQDQLQDARREHSQYQLEQFTPVRSQITEEKRQAFPCPCILLLAIVKVRSRLEEQCCSRIFSFHNGAAPATRQFGFFID